MLSFLHRRRLCTSDGILILPDGLDEHVVKVLEQVDKEEKEEMDAKSASE